MTSSSSWSRPLRSHDVSGERASALENKGSPPSSTTALSLGENEEEQQELLWTTRVNISKASDNPYLSPLVIGTVADGKHRLLERDEFISKAVTCPREFTAMMRFRELKDVSETYVHKADTIMSDLQVKLSCIDDELQRFRAALAAPGDADADSEMAGYIPLNISGINAYNAFSSPRDQAGSARSTDDAVGHDGSTRTTGPPAMDIAAAPSAAAVKDYVQIEIAIKKLEKEKEEILSQISALKADLKLDLHRLQSSPRYMMLKQDYETASDLAEHIYKESMMVLYSTLSTALGVSEFSKLAAAAGAVHDMPSDQAAKMWGWIVRSASRRDQAYFNSHFQDRNPIDYEPTPDLPLLTAFAELTSREQLFEQMGNTLTPWTKLSLRMRLVPVDNDTRLLRQMFGELQTKDVDGETLRAFEQQLSNIKGLRATCFRSQKQSMHEQRAQAKPSGAARLAQPPPQQRSLSPPLQQRSLSPPPPQQRAPQLQRSMPPSRPLPLAPPSQDARGMQQRDGLRRKHNGQHLYRDYIDRQRSFKGNKAVNFYGQDQADGNKARSSKATALLGSQRKGSFAVLGDLDGEEYPPLKPTPKPTGIQTKTGESGVHLTKKAHVLSALGAKGGYHGIFACADSGASLHIVDEKLITENRKTFVDGTVMWGDGSSTKTVVSGTVSATLTGKNGIKQKIRFPAWGVQHLETPLLSATAFARGGAALHVEKGNTYLDFRKLGGKRLLIGDDCMMRFNLSGCKQTFISKANAASASSASPKRNRRRRRANRLPQPQPPSPSPSLSQPAPGN